MELKEIYVTTIKAQNGESEEPEEGTQQTVGTLDMPIDVVGSMVKMRVKKNKDEKESQFEKLLTRTNEAIKLVADKLTDSVKNTENVSELEVEFGISFTEKAGIKIFELSSQQSIKVRMKLQK